MERIAVLIGNMHSGGKTNLVLEYYRHIDRSLVQFDFICNEGSNSTHKEEIENLGGRVFIIPKYTNIISHIISIAKLCRHNKYKIAHSYNGTMNLFDLFAAWLGKVPIRINESISMAHKSEKKTIVKYLLKPFSRCFSTHFMANGVECGKWQFGEPLYNKGKVTIFSSVINSDFNRFDPVLREKTRKEYLLDNCFVVGHIGRLEPQKNTLFLIDIFNEISKLKDDAKLLIIGDGKLKYEMLSKIKSCGLDDKVLYLGRREDIQQFYNAMDCFLLPSLYEGFPITALEAQCCGLPTIFSDTIPIESSPCDDLGCFINLEDSAQKWANKVIEFCFEKKRIDHSLEIKHKGFDSRSESDRLCLYYQNVIHSIN
ncbi:glycosyltransferase [Succinivibrio dextrinosolvens]|uniref:glycosyltransferase n=1 Tax=Succinivibrio dextrinosolvens TaxID=83771 RepID=UPI0004E0C132|nr:glycosyltransferase [Succinivibrio dextrinosolvens]